MAKLNGTLMTVICLVVGIGVSVAAFAQTETQLLSFDGTTAAGPKSPLTQGIDGSLYGMTYYGGTGTCFNEQGIGCGVIFKITHDHVLTVLYNFQDASNFFYPEGQLTLGSNGNLYGIAQNIIFKITPSGNLTMLHTFTGGAGGSTPTGGVVQGMDGNFYGTTFFGGTGSEFCGAQGCGTVFKMTPEGTVTTLYSFCPQDYCPDGTEPEGALVQGTDGDFYGTTTNEGLYHVGTVFKISPSGVFSTIYTFEQSYDDVYPGGLLLATDGNFYGTLSSGVFRVTLDGVFTSLGSAGAGYNANPLVQGTDGNIYGTTQNGGSDYGVIFIMPLSGSPSNLYTFAGYPKDGSNPFGGLVQATNGTFYGTTFAGGNTTCNYYVYPGCGTIVSLDMGLTPFVAFVNRAGGVGKQIGILGQGFAGTTSVEFNGTTASFTVKSDALLMATVPAAATTGYVTVTTPSGVLTSNVTFYVIP